MRKLLPYLVTFSVAAFFIFQGCEKLPVEELNVLESRAPQNGVNRIEITTIDLFGDSIRGGYNIEIKDLTYNTYNTRVTNYMRKVFVQDGVPPSRYRITVTKNGWIGAVKEIEFEGCDLEQVPPIAGCDYIWDVIMVMQPLNNCATIGQLGGTIRVRPLFNNSPGIGSRPGSVSFRPFSFDGPTCIGITPRPEDMEFGWQEVRYEKEGSYSFVCTPSGLTSGWPIETELPLDLTPAMENIPFDWVFKTGNIQTGDFQFAVPREANNIDVINSGADGVTFMDHFSAWQVVGQYKVIFEEFESRDYKFQSRCNYGLDFIFDTIGDYGENLRLIYNLPQDSLPVVREHIEIPGQVGDWLFLTINFTMRRYWVVTTNTPRPDTLEYGLFPVYPFKTEYYYSTCHNSGGGG